MIKLKKDNLNSKKDNRLEKYRQNHQFNKQFSKK